MDKVQVRSCEKIGSQAKAPAPLVGQTLPSANPACFPIFSQLLSLRTGAFNFLGYTVFQKMHHPRIAAFLLGSWLLGSLFLAFVATGISAL